MSVYFIKKGKKDEKTQPYLSLKILISGGERQAFAFIRVLKIPVEILGNGDISAFFKHVGYDGLDKLFNSK